MIQLRCSSLGSIITKSGNFTATAQKEAIKQFAASKWGRYDEVYSKYMEKGSFDNNFTVKSMLFIFTIFKFSCRSFSFHYSALFVVP